MNDFGLTALASGESVALRGVDVAAGISGLLAQTTLTQKYLNDTADNLELAYTFPLPVGGVLIAFSAMVGGRAFHGQVMPRSKAEAAYEEAISEGNSAFRVQEVRPGIFSATLGNVLAGEAIEITLTYAETLAWSGQNLRYRLPTTIAPRYGAPTGMQPWQRPETRLDAEYPLSLAVRLDGPLAKASIASPSHKVSVRTAEDALTVTLAAGASMDRDFILEIADVAVQSLGVSASARDTHVAVMTLLPPAIEPDAANARDIVIVLDCSGSMAGDSIALAKEGVQLGLGSLSPAERFAVIGFGSSFEHFDGELQPANRKNVELARAFVSRLGNLGGTELSQALERALVYADDRPMDILLLTDGEVWEADGITRKAGKKGIRIFTIGIGSAVAEDTVRALADKTGGACELVSPSEDMALRIFRYFNRMRQPKAAHLDIAWPRAPIWQSRPAHGCFAGDAYTVVAAFAEPVVEPVRVAFAFAGKPAVNQHVPLTRTDELSDAMVRIAARRHLAKLDSNKRQAWAVRYQLITDETDYLITLERNAGEKATSLPELHVVAQMLPAGWGGTSSVRTGAAHYAGGSPVSGHMAFASSFPDVPAVLRRAPRVVDDAPQVSFATSPYVQFLRNLETHADRSLFGSLPGGRKGLAKLGLPVELLDLIDNLVKEGWESSVVLLALYAALIEHDGHHDLGEKTAAKATALIGKKRPQPQLVSQFLDILNRLWREREQTQAAAQERHDIPAFLRMRAG